MQYPRIAICLMCSTIKASIQQVDVSSSRRACFILALMHLSPILHALLTMVTQGRASFKGTADAVKVMLCCFTYRFSLKFCWACMAESDWHAGDQGGYQKGA